MKDDPRMTRGEGLFPAPRTPVYPPRRPRWPAPAVRCARCELVSETTASRCPVCDAPFPRAGLIGMISRLRRKT